MGFELTKEFLELLNTAVQQKNAPWVEENLFILHHADIAAIIDELEFDDSVYIYKLLNEELQADVLVELDEDLRDNIISTFSSKEIAEQLEFMDSDDAADLINEFPQKQVEEVIGHITDVDTAEDIVDLLKYAPDTAGGLMQ
ncbi:MAG: magnesium transporter, partial [Crocinitomicaceae bacterium]|nr:magnesium transporter [Crocinitomicaceae bacterium]